MVFQPNFFRLQQFMDISGDLCYFEAIVQNWGSLGNLFVGALRATTSLTNQQSDSVQDELQEIHWEVTLKREIQVFG